jgi:hypothetical protein
MTQFDERVQSATLRLEHVVSASAAAVGVTVASLVEALPSPLESLNATYTLPQDSLSATETVTLDPTATTVDIDVTSLLFPQGVTLRRRVQQAPMDLTSVLQKTDPLTSSIEFKSRTFLQEALENKTATMGQCTFGTARVGRDSIDPQFENVHAVIFPAETATGIETKAYWQHVGEIVSSRRAEQALKILRTTSICWNESYSNESVATGVHSSPKSLPIHCDNVPIWKSYEKTR